MKKLLTLLLVVVMVFALTGCEDDLVNMGGVDNPTQTTGQAEGTSEPAGPITLEQAKEIAFNDAGVTEDVIYDYSYEQDIDNGREIFEIDFKADGYEYNYDIDAADGNIIKFDKEKDID